MSISAYRFDKVDYDGYTESDEITWGSVPVSDGIARSGVKTCYRVPGIYVVSDGIVTEGREVRKYAAGSGRVGYNTNVVMLGTVARTDGKWVAYTSAEKVGAYRTRREAAIAIYNRVRGIAA
jgi:hypothetical protein